MPMYEYECLECGIHFERFQRFSDPQPDSCPNGHSKVHRLLSAPAIIFKGSGFYATDHGRNGGSRSSTKKPSKKEPETTSSATTEDKANSAE